MKKRILVTEAHEIVATEVLNQLLSLEIPVRVAAGDAATLSGIRGESVETVVADYHDPDSLRDLFREVGGVFLGIPFAADLADMVRYLTDAARAHAVERVVYHSVMGADNPSYTIAGWHRRAEQYVESAGIAFTFLRPNIVMQDFITRQAERIRKEDLLAAPLGDARVSFVDARDVAACAVECLSDGEYHGRGYTLTGPRAITLVEVAEILSEVLDRRIEYRNISDDEARRDMAMRGAPEWLIDAHLDRYDRYRAGDTGSEVTGSVREIIGREPHDFRQFAGEYAEEWLATVGV